ncbi:MULTISPECIES: hypothetical protein [unclassified Corynebacterium]|nr:MULTISPECIES: hypothetical protein [unclassified Corynebacterium]
MSIIKDRGLLVADGGWELPGAIEAGRLSADTLFRHSATAAA